MFTWVYALVNRSNHSRNMNVVDDKDLFFRNWVFICENDDCIHISRICD